MWSYVFVGCPNAPKSYCVDGEGPGNGIVNVEKTPLITEKPYIIFENDRYFLVIPKVEVDKVGPSDYGHLQNDKIDFENVFVAKETDSVE